MATTIIHPDWIERLTTPPPGWQTSTFDNARGQRLHYAVSCPVDKIKGHVVYVEGLNEPTQKTYELARDFNKAGLSFSVFDRMGQSHGGRFLNNRFKVHSQGFQHDADDLITFVKAIIPKQEKVTLLGHSTGGLIALMAYHDHPELFTQPLINAPLLGIMNQHIRGHEHQFAALMLPQWIQRLYIPGGCDWGLRGTDKRLPQNTYSSHPERMKLHDYFAENNTSLRNGDPTMGWLWHACRAIVTARNPLWLRAVEPVTIVTAGMDTITDNSHVFKAIKDLPSAHHIHIKDAKHETLFETDGIRDRIIGETIKLALNR